MDQERFRRAVELFDREHAADPEGKSLDHHRRLDEWVRLLLPEPGEALLLAARCQHLKRWQVPRRDYPEGTTGYLRWRRAAAKFHAAESGRLLKEAGYPDELIAAVQALNRKDDPGSAEAQALEDALCLVFLQTQFHEFRSGKDESKVIDVLRKSWAKMSPRGREFALALPLDSADRETLARALKPG
jgi:hypothetical protein